MLSEVFETRCDVCGKIVYKKDEIALPDFILSYGTWDYNADKKTSWCCCSLKCLMKVINKTIKVDEYYK